MNITPFKGDIENIRQKGQHHFHVKADHRPNVQRTKRTKPNMVTRQICGIQSVQHQDKTIITKNLKSGILMLSN